MFWKEKRAGFWIFWRVFFLKDFLSKKMSVVGVPVLLDDFFENEHVELLAFFVRVFDKEHWFGILCEGFFEHLSRHLSAFPLTEDKLVCFVRRPHGSGNSALDGNWEEKKGKDVKVHFVLTFWFDCDFSVDKLFIRVVFIYENWAWRIVEGGSRGRRWFRSGARESDLPYWWRCLMNVCVLISRSTVVYSYLSWSVNSVALCYDYNKILNNILSAYVNKISRNKLFRWTIVRLENRTVFIQTYQSGLWVKIFFLKTLQTWRSQS